MTGKTKKVEQFVDFLHSREISALFVSIWTCTALFLGRKLCAGRSHPLDSSTPSRSTTNDGEYRRFDLAGDCPRCCTSDEGLSSISLMRKLNHFMMDGMLHMWMTPGVCLTFYLDIFYLSMSSSLR